MVGFLLPTRGRGTRTSQAVHVRSAQYLQGPARSAGALGPRSGGGLAEPGGREVQLGGDELSAVLLLCSRAPHFLSWTFYLRRLFLVASNNFGLCLAEVRFPLVGSLKGKLKGNHPFGGFSYFETTTLRFLEDASALEQKLGQMRLSIRVESSEGQSRECWFSQGPICSL